MTRAEYIKRIKVLLDEVSPFDEPAGFIASGEDKSYEVVKPVVSYIDGCLDRAASFCLNTLPTTLLSEDIATMQVQAAMDTEGVGHVSIDGYVRPVRIHDNEGILRRDITSFITTSSPIYLLQQNKHTRGKECKPVAAFRPEDGEIEIFSYYSGETCQASDVSLTTTLYYIDTSAKAETVRSGIADFVALMCAAYVEEILGDANAAQVFQQEFKNQLAGVLQ